MRAAFIVFAGICSAAALDPQAQALLDRISANDMKGNLSFLSSDLLEGRDTPSRGLDLASEFIAAQFRRAGLEPAFQNAEFELITPESAGFTLSVNGTAITEKVTIQNSAAVEIKDAPVVVVNSAKPPTLAGKVAVLAIPDMGAQAGRENMATYQRWLAATSAQHPLAIIQYNEGTPRGGRGGRGGARPRLVEVEVANRSPAVVTIADPGAAKLFEHKATVSIHAAAPAIKPAHLRNVTAILRGSDPELSKTYILVTAHYDHIGMKLDGDGDRIYNGANDDGSGTVSVIELANAFGQMNPRPKRSILFMTFFGEEKGLLGSQYYGSHPLVPLKDTIAQINLEQVGRTDDNEGPQVGTATFTGFTFSNIPSAFEAAGKELGIKVYNNEKNGDSYFARSDNQSLADSGIPAHTLCVAFDYPDYHGLGDEWPKVDYDNMAKIDRMVALGVLNMANDSKPPHWNESNPKTERYVAAWKALHK
jgi:hypothetical protein